MTDAERYVAVRETRRRSRSVIGLGFLIMMAFAVAFRSGVSAGIAAAIVAVVLVPGLSWSLVVAGRLTHPTVWRSSIPVWAALETGATLRYALRPNQELLGVVDIDGGRLTWTPTKASTRLGAVVAQWPASGAKLEKLWGLVPLAVLRISDERGNEAVIWIRDPRDMAAQF